MELMAIVEAVKTVKNIFTSAKKPITSITIMSDSDITVEGINDYLKDWKANGWKKKDKKEPKNLDLWQEYDEVSEGLVIKAIHIPREENKEADKLVKQSIKNYKEEHHEESISI